MIIGMETPYDLTPRLATERMLQHRSFDGSRLRPETDFLQSRRPVLVNDDCQVVLAARLRYSSRRKKFIIAQDHVLKGVDVGV
jgi:hypothetical protein